MRLAHRKTAGHQCGRPAFLLRRVRGRSADANFAHAVFGILEPLALVQALEAKSVRQVCVDTHTRYSSNCI